MRAANILNLGIKELRSLVRDPVMVVLIVYAFSFGIYAAATAMPETLHMAPIGIADEDHSQLSARIVDAFYPPFFSPELITPGTMDKRLDTGLDTFALDIPPDFERDVLAGRQPALQLNVDATRMSQAFTGNAYIQSIVTQTVNGFMRGHDRARAPPQVDLALRALFNPNLSESWFGSVMEIINNITMLAIVLTGAALIREREHGTVEHLLAMPVTPLEIMASKVWAMGVVVLAASAFALTVIVQGLLSVPISGSIALFLFGAALDLFATTSMGIFLGTVARSMPQFGLLIILVLLPLEMLSGGSTPRESMPELVQLVMLAAPTTHFVALAQAILYRGAGLGVVWPQLAALGGIGSVLFGLSLKRFRATIGQMA